MSKNRAGAGPEGHVWDLLSAYIDNSLDKATHAEVLAHLEECADCRADYIELRAAQRILKSLPVVPPPRAFTLTEEAVARRPGFLERLLAPRNSPRLAMGSVLSFALLVFVLLGNVVVASRPGAAVFTTAANVPPPELYSRSAGAAAGATSMPAAAMDSSAGAAQASPTTAAAAAQAPAPKEVPQTVTPPASGGGEAQASQPTPAAEGTPGALMGKSAGGSSPAGTPAPVGGFNSTGPVPGATGSGNLGASGTTSPRTTGSNVEPYATGRPAGPETRDTIVLSIVLALGLLGLLMGAGAVMARRQSR
jgi:hypothetical protein